ncbi:MAG: glucose-phosphate cytidylyltransferase [Gemmatimonadetes bacterium]|nr:glucose-phosphate cytidylyltransferase [Gemmatimonadota bacterium]
MKVVLLAGGLGSRLAEETDVKPKPMVAVGEQPILWHIMKHYSHFGFNEFVVALGYRGDVIKRFFVDYHTLNGSMTVDLKSGELTRRQDEQEDWRVHLVDTGKSANTGGRIKRLQPLLDSGTFMVTYGDGVCNVDLRDVLRFHREQGRLATVTAVRPPARFGGILFDGDRVAEFTEKPQIGEGWINGGFMIFEPGVFDYLEGDSTILEVEALEKLAADHQLSAYRHDGFWQCMDTLRDKWLLERLWQSGSAPWQVWA